MIAIVSHDAGGAEILSSWLQHNFQPHCLVLEGPANSIFQRKLKINTTYSLSEAVSLCDWMLCGTSWQSNLEKHAIMEAKAKGKKAIVFLDHWINYSERFLINGTEVLPDEIWVGDNLAEAIARKVFPEIKVKLVPNPYFRDLQTELQKTYTLAVDSKTHSILYVCEPIREHALLTHGDERYWGYVEEDALDFFLANVAVLGVNISEIKIRPHPSDHKNKYDWAKQINSLITETSSDKSLIEQIKEADIVVGCESMAMAVALLAKKRVISSIPPGGKACGLPHSEIEHFQGLVEDALKGL